MPGRLAGKVALITGGNYGIGEATARVFAREGAKVGLLARRASEGERVQKAIREQGGEATFVHCDVGERASIERAVAAVVTMYGALHVVFNNAGGGAMEVFPAETDETWERVLQLNLTGTMLVCREAWPHLVAAGGGSIVNMSSLAAVLGLSHFIMREKAPFPSASYGVAKAGIEALTRYLAGVGALHNIRVNCVRPGQIMTPRLRTESGDHRFAPALNEIQLITGPGQAEDVANAVLFLACDESRFITAEVMNVDGGGAAKL
jgi:NAD(P)-dependent dehydrogenase (short-subunit alcohol dehydrogenase family)